MLIYGSFFEYNRRVNAKLLIKNSRFMFHIQERSKMLDMITSLKSLGCFINMTR